MKNLVLLTSLFITACGVEDGDRSSMSGYYSGAKLWDKKDLVVCWQSPDSDYQTEKEWVKKRIRDTWQRHSSLRFTGWEECSLFIAEDIKIEVTSTIGPKTIGLGKDMSVMYLNFNLDSLFGRLCQTDNRRCIESTAIHEFGHALGLNHEHLRPDNPTPDCYSKAGGTHGDQTFGGYDSQSIMNYCQNMSYSNRLSEGDIATIKALYP